MHHRWLEESGSRLAALQCMCVYICIDIVGDNCDTEWKLLHNWVHGFTSAASTRFDGSIFNLIFSISNEWILEVDY